MSDRFSRQRGLVRQSVVSSLKISIDGVPDCLLESLITISEQLGVQSFPCNITESDYVICGDNSTLKSSMNSNAGKNKLTPEVISISYGNEGIYMDGTSPFMKSNPLYEPAVATISSCLLWNEILRRANAYLPVEVPKISVSVNARVDEHSMLGPLDELEFSLKRHKTYQNIRSINDGSGQRRVSLRLSEDDPLSIELCKRLDIIGGRNNNDPCEPSLHFNLPPLRTSPKGHATIVGAGGLGTWVLKTMVAGLSNFKTDKIKILVFDGDMEIESHNLNRQVIFSKSDIGKAKVEAAKNWLKQNLHPAEINIAYELLDGHILSLLSPINSSPFSLQGDEGGISFDELDDSNLINSDKLQILGDDEICKQLSQTDVILGCLDAMRPRTLADLAAAHLNQPYVNGGVQGLIANYCEYVDSSLVSKFGSQIATDEVVLSCQEDGDVPVASIVLSNALVGSFQALAALQRLTGQKASSIKSINWNLRTNQIWCVENTETERIQRNQFSLNLKEALFGGNKSNEKNLDTDISGNIIDGKTVR